MRTPPSRRQPPVPPPPGARPASATTADGVLLVGTAVPGGPTAVAGVTFVVGHGFTGSTGRPAVRRVLTALAGHGSVLALDFRGHGRSGGVASVGDTEVADVAAAVLLARAGGARRVVTVGFSMGASLVVRQAGGVPGSGGRDAQPDAVVSVSGPARWWARDTAAMRRVSWLCEQPHGRPVARLLGVRLGEPWSEVPASPVEVVHRIAPRPLLVVHGADDHYFGLAHPRALAAAAGPTAELWVEPGMDHAESATSTELAGRIGAWGARAVAAVPA